MQRWPRLRLRGERLLTGTRRRAFCAVVWLVWNAGCAAPVKVVSECPEPSPSEAEDLSLWLLEDPDRPAKDWAARVIGRMYPDELDEVRGGK